MSQESPQFTDPVQVARPFAAPTGMLLDFSLPRDQEILLCALDDLVDENGLGGTYFVEAGRALSIPVSFESNDDVYGLDLYDVAFKGPFTTFSILSVGKFASQHSVRALCASFESAFIASKLDSIPDDHMLHVPVLAVESIERTA